MTNEMRRCGALAGTWWTWWQITSDFHVEDVSWKKKRLENNGK